MKAPDCLLPTLRLYGLPVLGMALFALAVWRRWPLNDLVGDGGVLLWALVGLACVVGPNEVVSMGTLRGGGYSSFTNAEARTFEDADVVRVIGFVILLDALAGVGRWLVWTWW
ncbi:hypothetical protein [Botrimarina mediterranea]|uniref:Uncharacterized protein n=1 Tax=Botrimarina mediterranea TaxID=2528022 RepID=A0A518K311_9BACT|nr:hypothetical protein [Botrimarina mediterranea]QDV72193.1 hypothetical protein Spa11_03650 [Botrimarina mediterranea]QDV76736.1 hypothetical protein K2D_03170 [Planctomycetes bacterium K2D]